MEQDYEREEHFNIAMGVVFDQVEKLRSQRAAVRDDVGTIIDLTNLIEAHTRVLSRLNSELAKPVVAYIKDNCPYGRHRPGSAVCYRCDECPAYGIRFLCQQHLISEAEKMPLQQRWRTSSWQLADHDSCEMCTSIYSTVDIIDAQTGEVVARHGLTDPDRREHILHIVNTQDEYVLDDRTVRMACLECGRLCSWTEQADQVTDWGRCRGCASHD